MAAGPRSEEDAMKPEIDLVIRGAQVVSPEAIRPADMLPEGWREIRLFILYNRNNKV